MDQLRQLDILQAILLTDSGPWRSQPCELWLALSCPPVTMPGTCLETSARSTNTQSRLFIKNFNTHTHAEICTPFLMRKCDDKLKFELFYRSQNKSAFIHGCEEWQHCPHGTVLTACMAHFSWHCLLTPAHRAAKLMFSFFLLKVTCWSLRPAMARARRRSLHTKANDTLVNCNTKSLHTSTGNWHW
jgi:hypothetical protein